MARQMLALYREWIRLIFINETIQDYLKTIVEQMSTKNLYEKIGGADAVDAAVDIFYTKVLVDERIKHFFESVDMKRQAKHQKAFLTYALVGVSSYSGKIMRTSHKHLVEK